VGVGLRCADVTVDGDQVTTPRAILVPNADSLAGLAVIRSLGRAGHRVIGASARQDAIGFHSRWCAARLVHPSHLDPSFADWVADAVRTHGIEMLIPSESFFVGLRERYGEFARHFPLHQDRDVVERGFSKYALFERSSRLNTPPTRLVDTTDLDEPGLLAWLRSQPAPFFVKVDAVHSTTRTSLVRKADDASEAFVIVTGLRGVASRVVVQAWVPGRGVAVGLLRWDGEIVASMPFRRLHEVPHTGGPSSLREVIDAPVLEADARARLEALDWQGVAMVEYRQDDATGALALMEVNSRFWGSLHLALHAGVDFPRLLVERASGIASRGHPPVPRPIRARLLVPGELQHVASVVRDAACSPAEKREAITSLVLDTFDPRVKSDLLAFGDTGPALFSTRRYARVWRDALLDRIRARHGRLSGVLRAARTDAWALFGGTSRWTSPVSATPSRLVFVCKGNICRSAFAHARASGLPIAVASFGLDASDGAAPWAPIVETAARLGVDMRAHRATRLTAEAFRDGDLVLVFETDHARRVEALVPAGRTVDVRLFGALVAPRRLHVEDPYGLGDAYVRNCLAYVDTGVTQLGARLLAAESGRLVDAGAIVAASTPDAG
jgi:protein-tyrosine-phosphatase